MEDEICMICERDNGVTNNSHCKYCGDALCRNIWKFNHGINTTIKVKIHKDQKHFEPFRTFDDDYKYTFSCYSTQINFEEESIKFYIKDLIKPIFIMFDQVARMKINRHPNFHHY